MSKGLADLQATIQSYGSSQDSMNNYVQNYDNAFFQNWKEKVDLATLKLESGRKVADGIGAAYVGGKALTYSVNAFRNKYFNKGDKNPSDEDGNDEGGDPETEPTGGEGSSTGNADNVEDVGGETLGDGTEVVEPNLEAETNVGGESGFELQDMNTNSQPAQTGADGDAEETSFSEQTNSNPTSTDDVQPEPEDFVENPPPSQEMSQMGQSAEPQPSTSGGAGTSGETSTGLQQTDIQNQLQGTDPEALTAETAEETGAEALTTTATETAGETGSAVLGALGVGAEALGPIGLLTGIGIGLYELFHHPSKPPPAPKPLVASSKGEMVLPSYDAVIDTPASMTAF